MATIQFMPDRLNAEPVVFRGFTTPELGLTALFSTLAGIVISLPFLFFSWVMIPTIALILPLLVIVFGGKVLARIKRGKPENYLYRRLEAALVQWGLGNPRLILVSRRWSLRRSRAVIQLE
ncbi:TPA: TIGR03750 family conjugal transfer protein, partial [Klebsiella pneumoniae]|nr:TIGR03750 family conjugal transfer protein [Klebsiella pneumoniae]HDU1825963.1 TIGR03750 family conjugal transfer protein [Klebsiella pneumoniae]HDU1879308.1 TIGR03750 family conjugal transfer protein [Klebsiella pneumoniae]HDU2093073.1 TIGR03750 family conjugal transfer protein [Klebsiella pneumoniae]HDU2196255.1 TIGR03750 family conjugal transfer protein [Klebsiella pneumoniae]